MILDALREKAEYIPELQALIHNVQQGEYGIASLWLLRKNKHEILDLILIKEIYKNVKNCFMDFQKMVMSAQMKSRLSSAKPLTAGTTALANNILWNNI